MTKQTQERTYGRLDVFEGTVTTPTTITFTIPVHSIIIINDHASNTLSFKFNSAETNASLKAGESIRIHFEKTSIIIDGTSVPYRIWGIG